MKTPTPQELKDAGIVSAVNAVLMARVLAESEREKMDAVDRDILATATYMTDPEWTEKGRIPVHRILDHKELHLLVKSDWEDYYAERQKRIDAMGYKLPRGHCPACCAETVQRDAEHILVECAQKFFPEADVNGLLCLGLEKFHRYIELWIGLVVNMPDYKNPLTGKLVEAA